MTDRELEVLRLLAAGRSNQRIGHDLVMALDTVKKHMTQVLGKLGAANRTEAAARTRQLGHQCTRTCGKRSPASANRTCAGQPGNTAPPGAAATAR